MNNSSTNKMGKNLRKASKTMSTAMRYENKNTANGKDDHLEKLTGALLINKYPAFHRT
jgi:hypothetical protein